MQHFFVNVFIFEKIKINKLNAAPKNPRLRLVLLALSILASGIFGIKGVVILLVETFLSFSENVAKSLEVNNLALTKEFYNVAHVGVIRETKNIVIGYSCLLLC